MRVVSMVPSWTETLIEAGVDVVGRTRFCIHPAEKVKVIPIVGGTKDINWEKIRSRAFDYLLLDKEENPEDFALDADCEFVATHITSCDDVPAELKTLAAKFNCNRLKEYASRWEVVIGALKHQRKNSNLLQLHELSDEKCKSLGVVEWVQKPGSPYTDVIYVIWKKPYMAVTRETFVGSMLELVGLKTSLSKSAEKAYPEIDLEAFDRNKTLFLFSSEPFPFHKKIDELKSLGLASAIIDGESYSWFGLRALKFLEDQSK